jgi:hypothetical protein
MKYILFVIIVLFLCSGTIMPSMHPFLSPPTEAILCGGHSRDWLIIAKRIDSINVPTDHYHWTFILKGHKGRIWLNSLEGAGASNDFNWKLINEESGFPKLVKSQDGHTDTLDIEVVQVKDSSFAPQLQNFLKVLKFNGPRKRFSTRRESLFLQPTDITSNWNGS